MECSRVQLQSSNAATMQLRESTVFGLAIDSDSNLVVASTDFGHIIIHSLDGSVEKSRTLRSKWSPFYSMEFCTIGGEKSILCGGAGWICLWRLKDLLECADGVAPEPAHVYECKKLTAQLVSAQQHACADVNSIAHSADGAYIYAGCGDSMLYSFDAHTGLTTACSAAHQNYIHSVKSCNSIGVSSLLVSCDDDGVVQLWDGQRSPAAIGKCAVGEELHRWSSKGFSNRKAWCSTFDADPCGNFFYFAGGQESNAGNQSSPASCHGWVGAYHFTGNSLRPISVAKSPGPVQELITFGSELVCGGALPQIRYLSTTTLDTICSAPVSALSIFALSGIHTPERQQLVVGGTYPIIDLFMMKGNKSASFVPKLSVL